MGYGPLFLLIHKGGLRPSNGDINRLMYDDADVDNNTYNRHNL
jgi:hypothetical protein